MMRTFVAFFLALGICQSSLHLENVGDKDPDFGFQLPSGIVIPTAYKLQLTPDLVTFSFVGEVNITLIALISDNILMLHSKDLSINDVKFVDLNTTNILENEWNTDEIHEILNITINPQFEKDHHYSLHIKYNGNLSDSITGFYRSEILQEDGVIGYIAATQFQPTYARLAFPCWDEPVYKARFNITLTHNKTLQAVSNMGVLKTEEKDGMVTTSFKETPPMSTYMVAFVVSDYQFKEDRVGNFTYRMWAKESTINQTGYALKMGRKILEQLNSYTNISYQTHMPDKIDQVLVKDVFRGTAMENWGLVMYREDNHLYDEDLSTTRTKINILMDVAHVFTHQWFGNLVSPKSWRYIWLKEGFATYFQYFITHKIVPELRLDEMFVVESMQSFAMYADASRIVVAINHNVTSLRDVIDSFNKVAYNKVSSLIRMISHAMTEEVFHKGLKYYLTNNALGNVDSNDLFESLQRALDENGINWKQPVKVTMNNWVEEPGYPTLTVRRVDGGYELTQNRFVVMPMTMLQKPVKWWIPITYVEEWNPDFTNTTPVDWLAPTNESYFVPSEETMGWFIFNTQQTGFYRVNYDEENWKLLFEELNKGESTTIHVLNRAQIIDDAFFLASSGSLEYAIALNMSLYLRNETDYMPWYTAFRHLDFLRGVLRISENYNTFMRYVAYLMEALMENVGCEPKENESDLTKMLRVDTMKWACEAGVRSCISCAEYIYDQWVNNTEIGLDVNMKKVMLCAGIRTANESQWNDALNYIITSTPNQRDREDLLAVLACSNSSEILRKYLNSTLDPAYPIHLKTALKDVASQYPAGFQLVFDFLRNEYDRIEKLPDFQFAIKEIIEAIAAAVTTPEEFRSVIAFEKERQLERMMVQPLYPARRNMIWIKKFKPIIDEWLGANSHLFEKPCDGYNPMSVPAVVIVLISIVGFFFTLLY